MHWGISVGLVAIWLLLCVWLGWGVEMKEALIKRAKRTPYEHLDGYMKRYWLVPEEAVTLRRPIAWLLQRFGIAVRVHEILRSDLGRDPHNHPWSFLSIILFGCYHEELYDKRGRLISKKLHGPGSVLWRPHGTHHRLELPSGSKVLTLFVTFKKRSNWGFVVDGLPVDRRDYKGEQ